MENWQCQRLLGLMRLRFFFLDRAIYPYFIKRENVYRESTDHAGEQPA